MRNRNKLHWKVADTIANWDLRHRSPEEHAAKKKLIKKSNKHSMRHKQS